MNRKRGKGGRFLPKGQTEEANDQPKEKTPASLGVANGGVEKK